MPGTVRLHRVLATTPDKVYRAFLEPDAMTKWLPPNGFAATTHHQDAKVGGTFRMSFRNFTTGNAHSFGGEYLELVPGERLRYTDKFDDPNLPGEMQVTVGLKKVMVGTDVSIVQDGIPDMIPVEACYLGWQQSLENLGAAGGAEYPGLMLPARVRVDRRRLRMAGLILTTFDWVPEMPRGYVRDLRVRWALEEATLPYRVESVPFRDRGAEHFSHQPFGQVPWLTDGDISIFESGAILLHLGERSGALMPSGPRVRGEAIEWLFAALNSVEMASLPWSILKVLRRHR